MIPRTSSLTRSVLVLALATVFLLAAPANGASPSSHAYIVQGVPGASVDVKLDGKQVESGMGVKQVSGPISLSPGQHQVTFSSPAWTVDSTFSVTEPSLDIVLHWPADSTAKPEVTVFKNVVTPVPSGKGRVSVAHTAVVPPADIRVNGKVLFSNIANGEFVTAEVPAATYPVEVVPTGETKPLLGPVDLAVKAGALTRVFAIGAPKNGSMNAIVQVLPLPQSSASAPGSVQAGSAGLVASSVVHSTPRPGDRVGELVALGLALLAAAGLAVGARRRHANRDA